MVQIGHNFQEKENEILCKCGETENMKHIYISKYLNTEEIDYEKIFEENTKHHKIVLKRFRKNMEKRMYHGILIVDPLYSNAVVEIN